MLLVNLVSAFAVAIRRPVGQRWLLVTLLAGTSGSALVALLALRGGEAWARYLDVALVLMGLAALTVAVCVAAGSRRAGRESRPRGGGHLPPARTPDTPARRPREESG